MTLNRKECVALYEGAKCSGEVALFASTSRDAYDIASRAYCSQCPVLTLCLSHVNPASDGFTGTCADRLWYDGIDVTDTPDALPPPVFRIKDVDVALISAVLDGEEADWRSYSVSTSISIAWALRKRRYTLNKISKQSELPKIYVAKLVQAFDDGAPSDFKDFMLDILDGEW